RRSCAATRSTTGCLPAAARERGSDGSLSIARTTIGQSVVSCWCAYLRGASSSGGRHVVFRASKSEGRWLWCGGWVGCDAGGVGGRRDVAGRGDAGGRRRGARKSALAGLYAGCGCELRKPDDVHRGARYGLGSCCPGGR